MPSLTVDIAFDAEGRGLVGERFKPMTPWIEGAENGGLSERLAFCPRQTIGSKNGLCGSVGQIQSNGNRIDVTVLRQSDDAFCFQMDFTRMLGNVEDI